METIDFRIPHGEYARMPQMPGGSDTESIMLSTAEGNGHLHDELCDEIEQAEAILARVAEVKARLEEADAFVEWREGVRCLYAGLRADEQGEFVEVDLAEGGVERRRDPQEVANWKKLWAAWDRRESAKRTAGGRTPVPYPHYPILTDGYHLFAVGTECHAVHGTLVGIEFK